MITCTICNKEFSNNKELTKHLVEVHSFSTKDIYFYYNYSFETKEATCPVCGQKFVMTKRQIDGFKKNKNKSIGCCTSCSKALIILTHGSPLANPKIHEKTRKTLYKHYGVTCPAKSKIIQEKTKQTNLEKYGVENPIQVEKFKEKAKETSLKKFGTEYAIASKEVRDKAKKTLMENYGVENAFQSEVIKNKIREKNLETYGVEHAMQSEEVQERMRQTNLEKYGAEYPLQSLEIQEKAKGNLKKTMLKKYGFESALQVPEIKERIKETMIDKYGVEYFCQHEKCLNSNHLRISGLNLKFQEFLSESSINSELEFVVKNFGFDLRVNDTLVELNPWFTHNVTIGPIFKGAQVKPRSINYHQNKTNIAKENGYKCIHVFDWDDWNKVANLLKEREQIYARKCEAKKIRKKEANEFLNKYHLQENSRGIAYAYGLFYNNELVQVMTFGKPRYNRNYEYELLRLCTAPEVSVVGGASKILSYFEEQISPSSIISYCDLSKFSGEVYENMGFSLTSTTTPARHWYNPKTKRHITDNLLRQRGFDQLHKTSFGKGTSNEALMLEHGYVEIYDCGQAVFVKNY